jgi:microcystin degradation protein MlrC
MRYAVGTLSLECNSFSPERTDLDYFRRNGYLLFGDQVLDYHRHVKNELSGFLDVCARQGVDVIPTCAAWAVPHGPAVPSAYDDLKREFVTRIRDAGAIDGVYLSLHGSMLVEGLDDPEGDLLEAVKRLIGDRPLVATLDLHANVTARMARHADILLGYNTHPHTNLFETGQKAGGLAVRFHDQVKDLRRIFIKLPIIAPMQNLVTIGDAPLARIISAIEQQEGEDGILAMSFFVVQCWLDIEEMGCSALGVARKERVGQAQEALGRAAMEFWDRRAQFFDFPVFPPEEAIRQGLASDEQPILLSEPSDNAGAGATGDSTHILEAMLRLQVTAPSLLPIVDPEAVEACIRAGVGATVTLSVGGKLNRGYSRPVEVRGRVRTISDGQYRYTGPTYHGVSTSMGRTVVLEVGDAIFVELTELPVFTLDPEHYRCVGLHPERMKFVVVKSASAFRASYDPIAKHIYFLDTPGISSSNIRQLPFTRPDIRRLYPFNQALAFQPTPLVLGGV